MPSQRRVKVFALLLVVALAAVYYITSSAHSTRTSDFYTRTVAAIDARQRAADADATDLDAAHAKLRDGVALQDAKTAQAKIVVGQETQGNGVADAAAAAAPTVKDGVKDAVHGVADAGAAVGEKSVAGRKMMKDGQKPVKDDGVAKVGNTGAKPSLLAHEEDKTDEDKEVEMELNDILKKSPIIIFSKSYCPYSKKAKHILLDLYKIVPAPFVVELDQHPLGAGLQAALGKSTGRRTVPNVLISGKSIGGGDDIEALADENKLMETVTAMGGKRIMEAIKL